MSTVWISNSCQTQNYTPLNPCVRTSYAPTNPLGSSPYVQDTVVWNSRTGSSYVYSQPQTEVAWRNSNTSSSTPRTSVNPLKSTTTQARVGMTITSTERKTQTVNRYSPDNISPSCFPSIKTVCPPTINVSYTSTRCAFPTASSSNVVYGSFNREG